MIVKEHPVHITTLLPPKSNRDHLPAFGIIAKPRGIGHADELIFDDRLGGFERLRHRQAHLLWIRAVCNNQVFAVVEVVRPRWIGRVRQGHCKCISSDCLCVHQSSETS